MTALTNSSTISEQYVSPSDSAEAARYYANQGLGDVATEDIKDEFTGLLMEDLGLGVPDDRN